MKIEKDFSLSILIILLAFGLSDWGFAESPKPRLPGFEMKLENAVNLADSIVIGTVISLGKTRPASLGVHTYHEAKIDIEKVLKGSQLQGEIEVAITVHTGANRLGEGDPEEGKKYIFFISEEKKDKRRAIFKIIESDEADIAAVAAAIAAPTSGKPPEKNIQRVLPNSDHDRRVRYLGEPGQ